jgi:integrase
MRHRSGSVVEDKRSKTWFFYWWENGKRLCKKIGSRAEFPTKSTAWNAAQALHAANTTKPPSTALVKALVEAYQKEKMPRRYSTSRVYKIWFKAYIVKTWGEKPITELQPRPVELWLDSLTLSPKSRAHIRGLMHTLWDYAMWSGNVPVQVNPISLVTVKGASKRTRQPRSLTAKEFQDFLSHLAEPFRTIALVCACFGLRISECLALQWKDVDWLGGTLTIERGIVRYRVDEVKTPTSQRKLPIDPDMLSVIKTWKQTSQFSSDTDWMFASTAQIGRMPWSYDQVRVMFIRASKDAGIGKIGTHSMRHSYRSWLDAVGTKLAVQQKCMRHADIRTTMNIYGDVVTDEMNEASGKITRFALNGMQTAGKTS